MKPPELTKLKKLLRNWDGEGILTKFGIDDLAMVLNGVLSCENGEVKVDQRKKTSNS